MRGPFPALTLALLALLIPPGEARAHRLDAACRFLPGRMVRVESWFDNGQTPKSGEVEVSREDGEVLVKGRLSSQGLFVFDAPEGGPLRVVVEAGEGHRAEVAIKPEELLVAQASPTDVATPPRHDESFPIKDVMMGVGLLIALAALFLSLRNTQRIRELRQPTRIPPGDRSQVSQGGDT
jgi:nickel transport protein